MSHNYKKYKLLRKFVNFFGFKLIEKNYIKNLIQIENYSIEIGKFLEIIIKKNSIKKLIQVGANNGITDDFIRDIIKKFDLKAILVEPLPDAFKDLEKNYKNFDVILVNKALNVESLNYEKFYSIDEKYLKIYFNNINVLSSFNKDNLINWGVKESHIKSIKVECTTWKDLMKTYDFREVDLICLDTEGFDHVLVKNFLETNNIRPVIIFEWVNIPYKLTRSLMETLTKNGYNFLKFKKDLLCYNKNIII